MEADRQYHICVTLECDAALFAVDIPESHHPIAAAAGQQATIGAEADGPLICVIVERGKATPTVDVPQTYGLISATTGQQRAIGAEAD
jgi:hypothetical protein